MNTDDLIQDLVADLTVRWPLSRAFGVAVMVGALVAAILFFASLGLRPDIAQALRTIRFPFKFIVTLSLAATAIGVVIQMARPGASLGWWAWGLAAAPVLLGLAVLLELWSVPPAAWEARWVGRNALPCSLAIPFLALGPLACILAALRYGAPLRPRLAGAVAGLAASGIGASFYAAHCPDDSPLFVATWYVIATGVVALLGSIAGAKLLKW